MLKNGAKKKHWFLLSWVQSRVVHLAQEDSSKLIRLRLNGKGEEQWCKIIGWTRLLPNHIYCGLNHQVVRLFQKLVNECLKLCHSCWAKGKSSCGFTKCSGCLQFHIHKCHLSTSSCQYSKSLNAMKTNQQTSLYQEAFSCRGTLGLEVLGHSQAPWKEKGKGQAFWEARIRSQPLHSSITDFWLGKGNH